MRLVPLSHPFVERLIGTMRREFLDHVLFWNGRDLERKLVDFETYYNAARVHASLHGQTPVTFAGGHTVARAELTNVRWVSHCRDLSSTQQRPDDEFETDTHVGGHDGAGTRQPNRRNAVRRGNRGNASS